MKNIFNSTGFLAIAALLLVSCNATGDTATTTAGQVNMDMSSWSTNDSVSYSWGMLYGGDLKNQGIDINGRLYSEGFANSFDEKEDLIDKAVAERLMNTYMAKMQKEKELEAVSKNENKKKAGEAFLANNAKREGVKTTASGLQYEVLKSGSGKTPKSTDRVKVHYTGTFIDGKVFDSSVERGEPIEFGFSEVIKGWGEALQLMKEGDKWKVYIPSYLAYGDQGRGPIPGGESLIFEMELLEVLP